MHPSELKINDFTYSLPEERVARYPLAERDNSKLLIYNEGEISENTYRNIADYLPANSLLVFNNTKVIHARMMFQTSTGAKVEVFCLEPYSTTPDMATAMSLASSARWKCMVGRASKWKEKVLVKETKDFKLEAELVERLPDAFVVEFRWQPSHFTFAEILDATGAMPIPPYLKRQSEDIDLKRYQTIYAAHEGSVAAPTAGLHFTENIFQSLKEKNISHEYVTLHVGAGTFKPVKSETMQGHEMHEEWIEVSSATIQHLLENLSQTIIAVGTTSLRTIETLYWMGVKTISQPDASINNLEIHQWDAYELEQQPTPQIALQSLLQWIEKNNLQTLFCKTQILIAPGYKLKIAKGLVTNFHQPNSTLLLLVAAMVGDDWRKIYDYALANQFRFLSYGDGSLLFAK